MRFRLFFLVGLCFVLGEARLGNTGKVKLQVQYTGNCCALEGDSTYGWAFSFTMSMYSHFAYAQPITVTTKAVPINDDTDTPIYSEALTYTFTGQGWPSSQMNVPTGEYWIISATTSIASDPGEGRRSYLNIRSDGSYQFMSFQSFASQQLLQYHNGTIPQMDTSDPGLSSGAKDSVLTIKVRDLRGKPVPYICVKMSSNSPNSQSLSNKTGADGSCSISYTADQMIYQLQAGSYNTRVKIFDPITQALYVSKIQNFVAISGTFDMNITFPTPKGFQILMTKFDKIVANVSSKLGYNITTQVNVWYPEFSTLYLNSNDFFVDEDDVFIESSTLAHEWGHVVMWELTQPWWPSPGGEHDLCAEANSSGLAYVEGYANAFAMVVDPLGPQPGVFIWVDPATSGTYAINLERLNFCDFPQNMNVSEARVAAGLWDIYDIANDTNLVNGVRNFALGRGNFSDSNSNFRLTAKELFVLSIQKNGTQPYNRKFCSMEDYWDYMYWCYVPVGYRQQTGNCMSFNYNYPRRLGPSPSTWYTCATWFASDRTCS